MYKKTLLKTFQEESNYSSGTTDDDHSHSLIFKEGKWIKPEEQSVSLIFKGGKWLKPNEIEMKSDVAVDEDEDGWHLVQSRAKRRQNRFRFRFPGRSEEDAICVSSDTTDDDTLPDLEPETERDAKEDSSLLSFPPPLAHSTPVMFEGDDEQGNSEKVVHGEEVGLLAVGNENPRETNQTNNIVMPSVFTSDPPSGKTATPTKVARKPEDKDADFIARSINVPWTELDMHLNTFDRKIQLIDGDGFCFFQSLATCLNQDFNMPVNTPEVIQRTLDEINENVGYYKLFHPGGKKELLEDCAKFISEREYILDVVDVCIGAAANALKANLYIFQNVAGQAMCVKTPSLHDDASDVFLRYTHAGGKYHGSDHYDAILLKKEALGSNVLRQHPHTESLKKNLLTVEDVGEDLSADGVMDRGMQQQSCDMEDDDVTVIYDPNLYNSLIDVQSTPTPIEIDTPDDTETPDLLDIDDPAITGIVPDSIDSDSGKRHRKRKKNFLNMSRFTNVAAQAVNQLPWDIDGDYIYEITCTEDYWYDRQVDGRHWKTCHSTRKDLNGSRRFSTCKGTFVCENPDCPKVTSEGVKNKVDFKREKEGGHTCSICGYYVRRTYCPAIKVSEFEPNLDRLTVWHQNTHTCLLKPNRNANRSFLESEVLDRNLRSTPKEMKLDLIGYYMAEDNPDKAWEVAQKMTDKSILNKLRYAREGEHAGLGIADVDSFKQIGKLKKSADKRDKYYIYGMNCGEINNCGEEDPESKSYVMKTSARALAVAAKLDPHNTPRGEKPSALAYEFIYIDGMHSRVKGYVTLTMWVYHPGMKRILRLAIMDCEHENTAAIKKFFELFRKCMAEVTGDPSYEWKPYGIMCDENGANQNAVKEVFGEAYLGKIVTCQWHFMECARQQLSKVQKSDRATFNAMVEKMCYTYTANEYKKVKNSLEAICARNNISKWLQWWATRKYHIVPVFRGFCISGLNLAEPGHSSVKVKGKMWLSQAAWRDVLSMIAQDAEYEAFITNAAKVTGKGPTLLQRQEKEKRAERQFIAACIEALEEGDLVAEMDAEVSDPRKYFKSHKKAKHKAPKLFSRRNPSQTADSNIQGKKKENEEKEKSNAILSKRQRKTTKKEDYVYGSTSRKRKIEEVISDSDSDEEEESRIARELEQHKLAQNPICVVLMKSTIKKCSGCDFKFGNQDRQAPDDLLFRLQMYRMRPCADGTWVRKSYRENAYFHARDLACVRQVAEFNGAQMTDLYCDNHSFAALSKAHIKKLKMRGMWDYIVQSRSDTRQGKV